MRQILALDLGKFKTAACLLTDDVSELPVFSTIVTSPQQFETFLLKHKPTLLVIEACGLSGWVVDLARKLEIEVLVAHPGVTLGNRERSSVKPIKTMRKPCQDGSQSRDCKRPCPFA